MDIAVVTTVIASLFLVIAAAEPLAARLRLPFSVILAALGVLIVNRSGFIGDLWLDFTRPYLMARAAHRSFLRPLLAGYFR